jgi:D-alanyl-D-alanine endopeptidase (penicillin-binding protein 7)
VADLETGQVVMSKNEDQVEPIASVSKLLTALTSLETINQYRDIVVDDASTQTYGHQGGLRVGESLPASELIYPLLLESSNDAAEVLARYYGRNQFIEQINNKAKAIGLTATKFEDPSGLSPKNVSTARDLAKLAHYLYQSKRFVFDVTAKRERSFGNHDWFNNNKLVGTEGYLGGKNGFTDEARQTQVALFELPLSEFTKRKVAVIILKSSDRENDMAKLVDYLKKYVVFGEKPANSTFKYL